MSAFICLSIRVRIESHSRYVKYKARVSALALDPAVQGIVYCAIFIFMPLGHALLPLVLKESVYLLWVIKEVLQIAAPGEHFLMPKAKNPFREGCGNAMGR